MELINKLTPRFVLVMSCGIFYMAANFGGPLFPLEHKWTFYLPLVLFGVSIVCLVRASFLLNAVIDRMEKR